MSGRPGIVTCSMLHVAFRGLECYACALELYACAFRGVRWKRWGEDSRGSITRDAKRRDGESREGEKSRDGKG